MNQTMKTDRWYTYVMILILWSGAHLSAQGQELVELPRLSGAIRLDGRSDEAAWEALDPLPMTVHSPVFEAPPTERTEIRIAYDDDYLYAAGRFYDSDPSGIRGNSLVRDGSSPGEDNFGLILDTFNDNENALGFMTTPAGIRWDMAVYGDAVAGGHGYPWNSSWDTFWGAAVVRTDEGWFAEMQIPLSSLRFQDKEGRVVMGMSTFRLIARKNETHVYPSIPPRWDWGVFKPSVAQDVVFTGIKSRNPLYVKPYLVGGTDQVSELNTAGDAYARTSQLAGNIGLDLKYGLSSNWTLDLTFNTDFAQVEADNEEINLTQFSLFFPEKRLFFQERASVFDFRMGGPNRLFYSRQIGLYELEEDEFQSVPILGGARLVGRLGDWDIGLLDMQTARAELEVDSDSTVKVPSENFGVLRLRRQVLNRYSYAGGMVTSRIGSDGRTNTGLGVDALLRLFGDDYLVLNLAQTMDSEQSTGSQPLGATRFLGSWERRANEGWVYDLNISRAGADYLPRLGFESRTDYTRLGMELGYEWMPGEDSRVYRHSPEVNLSFHFHNDSTILGFDEVESYELGPAWGYEGKAGDFGRIWVQQQYESLTDTLFLPEDNWVPPGAYTFNEIALFYRMPYSKLLRSGIRLQLGDFYDGRQISVGLMPDWIVSPHLSFGGEYRFTRGVFDERDQSFNAHLLTLRTQITFNTRLSIVTLGQYNSDDDAVSVNFRLRYNPREGTDLYLVYNDGLNTDRERVHPALPVSDSRTILLKYSTTFLPKLSWISW
ncbi:DUF5916 domain-containing protein [Candidatus Neomarinimicrobiota bacterium]